MRLQEIQFFSPEDIQVKELYIKTSGAVKLNQRENCLQFEKGGGKVSFQTYFNSFSLKKWKKYTRAEDFYVSLLGQGQLHVTLWGASLEEGGSLDIKLAEETCFMEALEVCCLKVPKDCREQLLYLEVAGEEGTRLESAAFETPQEFPLNEISIAVDICTFRREAYLKRNIDAIREQILENADAAAKDALEVFISDNAGTLDEMFASYPHVHVKRNENTGGVGGFTRGMLEAKRFGRQFSHVLIMDDDAIIDPAVLERTYCFLSCLKEQYLDYTLGGSLLRQNTPYIQYELGATWNRGRIGTNYHHANLRNFREVLQNEVEREADYCGWWYSCIPMKVIDEAGLPLPIFIHRDDIEYGIRTGKKFIFLNGIAIWHEAFENKMPGATEYYDIRNLAIINSIHYKNYGKREFQKLLIKWVSSNVARYRYRYIDMNLRGAEDFLKGIDWLKKQDGTRLHQEILKLNYRACDAKDYVGYKNITEELCRWERLEKLENRRLGRGRKLWQLLLLNGYFLPAKRKEVLVAGPHDNVYEMFRAGSILYIDSNEKAVLMKRSIRRAFAAYRQLLRILMQIERNFDIIRNGYQERYQELTTDKYWGEYLHLTEGNHE